jgi:biopolymer transport protein ExbD
VDADTLTIDLAAGGAIFANGDEMSGETQLRQVARSALARQPKVRAVIRADGSIAYGQVIHLLDLLRQEGITQIAFAVASAP